MKAALFAFIALILVGDGIGIATIKSDSAPSKWDPRIAPLAHFVEDARHLRFDHPVEAKFLPVKEYEKAAGGDGGELTAEDKAEIASEEGELRALGLLQQGASLYDDATAITSGGTLAFYDPDSEKMVIRGTNLTIGMKVTVVHELTHALQDQHFDLSREFTSETRSDVFHALGEGDATRIENVYVDSLSDSESDAYDAEQDQSQDEAEAAIADVSPFLTQLFGAPYALGEPLTSIVVETKGVAGLNALFRNPPASDEVLMNPFALLDGAQGTRVGRPKLLSGERLVHAGEFGALQWYLMLSAFIDQKVALAASDGLNGDAYVSFRKSGRACVRVTFVGDTPQDNHEMQAALQQWKTAFSTETVDVRGSDTEVAFQSCEPQTTAPKPVAGSDQALALPTTRYTLVKEILTSGGTQKLARCATRELFARLTVQQLNPQSEAEARPLQNAVPQVARFCATHGEA